MGREKYRDWTVFCLQLSSFFFFIHSPPKSGLNMWSCWFPCEELLDLSTLISWSSPSLQFFPAKRKQKMDHCWHQAWHAAVGTLIAFKRKINDWTYVSELKRFSPHLLETKKERQGEVCSHESLKKLGNWCARGPHCVAFHEKNFSASIECWENHGSVTPFPFSLLYCFHLH